MTTIATSPLDIALALAAQHEELARTTPAESEAKAHKSTMRQFDRALAEMTKGNYPVKAGAVWLVNSRTDGGAAYRIDPVRETCTCEAGLHNKPCWHVAAVQVMELAVSSDASPQAEQAAGVDVFSPYAPAVVDDDLPF